MIIDSDSAIRNISRYHANMKIYRKYICLLSDTANCPEDLYQISSKNSIYGIYRNMTTESTFPIRICCLCFGITIEKKGEYLDMAVNNRSLLMHSYCKGKRLNCITKTVECPITLYEMYRWEYYRNHKNLDAVTICASYFAYKTFEASKIKTASIEDLSKQRR